MKVSLRMRWTVITAALALGVEGSGSAFTGPGADLTIIGSAWAVMIVALALQAGVSLDRSTALKIATAMLMSFGSFLGGSKLAIQAFALTGVGTLPAIGANCGINAGITYLAGMAIATILVQENRITSVESFAGAVVTAVLASLGLHSGGTPSA